MAPSKLSDADKQTILELYRHPEETTSTLAERYGVSNSTISRLLKSSLAEADYAALIQQKRAGEKAPAADLPSSVVTPELPKLSVVKKGVVPPPAAPEPVAEPAGQPAPAAEPTAAAPSAAPSSPKIAPPRRRASTADSAETQLPLLPDAGDLPKADLPREATGPKDYGLPPIGVAEAEAEAEAKAKLSPEDAIAAAISPPKTRSEPEIADYDDDLGDDLNDDLDDLDDEDLEDDEEFDDDEDLGNWKFSKTGTPQLQTVQISPLTTAALPRLCYIVVDRNSSELITCPLRDFAELGQIPEGEVDSRTLPVFDNHRIARRFSRRNHRVVKVPDGTMLQKTSPYLQAKGITRLLIDGHIYALEAVAAADELASFDEDS